jgi:hypothetical protein
MICELCSKSVPHDVVILPIKQGNGKLDTIACMECAEKQPTFCLKHMLPHIGFEEGGTVCRCCVTDRERELESQGVIYLRQIEGILPEFELLRFKDRMNEYLELGHPLEWTVLHLLVVKAMRQGKTEVDILKELELSKNADTIIS